MRRRFIVLICAAMLAVLALPCAAMAENNSVSGYVSLTEGKLITGYKTTLTIQYGEDEDRSVVRAIGDLADDIKAVTGRDSAKVKDNFPLIGSAPPHGIVYYGDTDMTVYTDEAVPANSKCYVAAYNADGTLNAVLEADKANYVDEEGDTTIFEFDKALKRPACGDIKAFVWDGNMKPVLDEPLGIEDNAATLVVGTLGAGGLVDVFAKTNDSIAALEGKWESFTVQEVGGYTVIAGSDKRGTIYGIYDLCEKIGVSPWKFWADVEPEKAEELYINLPKDGYTEGEPSVKYRGIFLNDEYNMSTWSNTQIPTNMNNAKYEKVFELLLRLKANTLWPAMHKYSTAFHNIDGAAALADDYGIVMGSSHAEPLLRNNLGELNDYQDKWEADPENAGKTLYKPVKNETGNKSVAYYWTDNDKYENGVATGNPVANKEFLEDYWRECVKENGGYDNIYTLGMRDVHDGSFRTNMDYATALNEIIATQRKIIQEEVCTPQNKTLADVPQVFIPYKDILSLYNKGQLNIPDDVTIMWTDDNYGYMRQSASDAERERGGGVGVYYHISYYGYPTSYLWLSATQPGLIREELTRTYDLGSKKMWILNVGDLKPAEKEIEYYARLARNIDEVRDTDIADIYADTAKRDFNLSDADAKTYAEMMDEFYALANSKRPDFLRANDLTFSVTDYGDEGQRYIDRYNAITETAEELYNKLPESKKPSFFELALYPIRSAKNMTANYIQSYRADVYNNQGRGAVVNRYAKEAGDSVKEIEEDIKYYNEMLDGKWNGMANINPSELQGCDAQITLDLNPPTVEGLYYTDMGIAVEGQTDLSSAPSLTVSKYDTRAKFVDIFNTGYGSFDYEISSASDAVRFNKTSGTVSGNDRVYVSFNPASASQDTSAVVTVTAKVNGNTIGTKTFNAVIENPADVTAPKTYVEAGGTVSVEAEHFTNSVKNGDYEWKVEKDFGRSGDSLKIYPDTAANTGASASDIAAKVSDSAYAEYDVVFANSGDYNLAVYRMPTLNERGNMRFAIGIDDEAPTVYGGTSAYSGSSDKSNAWSRGVLDNTEKLTGKITVPSAGKHTIKLYNIAPGVVIDKIVLTKNAAPLSYFAAPESYNTTYNNEFEAIPSYTDTVDASEIKKLFVPDIAAQKIEAYKEDFEAYTVNTSDWRLGANAKALTEAPSVENDNTKYIKLTAGTKSAGEYTTFGPVSKNAEDSGIIDVSFDLRITKPSGSNLGDTQVSIGSSSPTFSGSNIDWGVKSDSSGHLLLIECIGSSGKLSVNGQNVDSSLVGDWTHVDMQINFNTKRLTVTLSNDETTVTLNNISVYNQTVQDNIGSLYMKAAGGGTAGGTISVDNLAVYKESDPLYAVSVKAVDSDTGAPVSNANIILTRVSTGAAVSAEADGEYAGKYLIADDEYTISASAGGYLSVNNKAADIDSAIENREMVVAMRATSSVTPAAVTLKYVDEESNEIKTETITEDLYVGEEYTVPEDKMKDFTFKNTSGKYQRCTFRSVNPSSGKITLAAQNEITLIYNYKLYDYYEDFENYTVSGWTAGTAGIVPTLKNDNTKYLEEQAGSGSIGAYKLIDAIDCTGMVANIEFDVRFNPKGTSGNAQFTIGSSSPKFSSDKPDYGMGNNGSYSAGHIIGLEFNGGSTLLINQQELSSDLVGKWLHVSADADFFAGKATITVSADGMEDVTFDKVDFISANAITDIGSMYMRAAGKNGIVAVDNVTVKITGTGEPAETNALTDKTVYAFGDSIVYGHNAPETSFMQLMANRYGMKLKMMAVNGATVIDSSNDIKKQVDGAPAAKPDIVFFDGYTNDAYGAYGTDTYNDKNYDDVTQKIGTRQGSAAAEFDSTTFCGAFEELLCTMKTKWPDVPIVFITIHKSGARDFTIQTTLRDLAVAMCEDWGVEVVDMFGDDISLDTRDSAQMAKYMMGGKGSHPNVLCSNEFYIPKVSEKLLSLYE